METDRNKTFNSENEFDAIFSSVFGDSLSVGGDDSPAYPEEDVRLEGISGSGDLPDVSGDDTISYEPVQEASGEYHQKTLSSDGDEIEFDPRFRLGRRDHSSYSYGRTPVDAGPDPFYSGRKRSTENEEFIASYGDNEYDGSYDPEPESAPEKKGLAKLFEKKGKRKEKPDKLAPEEEESIEKDLYSISSEESREEAAPADDEDYESYFSEYGNDFSDDSAFEEELPASFRQYLVSRITGFFLKLRGGLPAASVPDVGNCDEAYEAELGHEIPLLNASKYYGSNIHSLQLRFRISLALLAIELYLSFGLPAPGMLRATKVAACACLALHFMIMLLSLDVFTNGLTNIFRKRFGADSLASVSCLVTALDGLLVIYGKTPIHMPLCSAASLSLVGVLFSSLLSAKALRKTLRVPAIGKQLYSVTVERGVIGKETTILKSSRLPDGFVRRSEETPPDEEAFRKFAPFIVAGSVLFSVLIAVVKNNLSILLYIFSAIFAVSVPFCALLSFALPFFVNAYSLFSNGVAIAGWSGTIDLGNCKNLIVTDRDLFPENCIKIENVRIFADYDSDKVISYAGSMIINSGCGLAPAFKILMEENGCELLNTDLFEKLAGGGLKAMIEGHSVICGNTDLMRLMDVKIPFRLVSDTSVLLSIDGILYGIFNIEYSPDPSVRRGLVSLMRSTRHPVFAVRDFNVTPELIRDKFDVATDGYDFPPYADRFYLSEAQPAKDSKIAAAIGREGLGPLVSMVDAGRNLYSASRANVALTLLSSAAGILFVTLKFLIWGSVSVSSILLFMILTAVPVFIIAILSVSIK